MNAWATIVANAKVNTVKQGRTRSSSTTRTPSSRWTASDWSPTYMMSGRNQLSNAIVPNTPTARNWLSPGRA